MAKRLGENALVIGGSMAGLMTARVLADYFQSVTVLERDRIQQTLAPHKSVPQGNHLHGVQLGGLRVMESLYPDFLTKLESLGSVRCRMAKEVVFYGPFGKAYSPTGAVREPRDFEIDFYQQSRGLLEHCVRQCTLERANVKFLDDCLVQGLVCRNNRIEGVQYKEDGAPHSVGADLIVDAGGRGSHASQWLAEFGFKAPLETSLGVDLAYASAKYRVPEDYDRKEKLVCFDVALPPDFPNCALMEIIEDDLLHVTLAGRFGDYPPPDEAGLMAFARSLSTPRLYDLIKGAKRVSEITSFRYPSAVLRHYERLPSFPEGFLVLGDAIASFNPVYGQGMSVAALQVQALQNLLAERTAQDQGLSGLALSFFPTAADIAKNAWELAAEQDLAYPQTQGERPADLNQKLAYFAALFSLSAEDPEIHRLMIEVFTLCKPLSALNEESLRTRVLEEQHKHPQNYQFN